MKNKFQNILLILIAALLFAGCEKEYSEKGSPEYIKEINDWHRTRIENLKKENGWLNLVGLYWLKEGENTFGSDPTNDILFPEGKADKFIGKFIKKESIITVIINEGAKVYFNNSPVREMRLIDDMHPNKTVLSHKTLRWFIIKRFPDKYGVRLRDLEAELLKNFEGIERFPVNEDWKITADFIPYNPPKELSIPTIIGTIEKEFSPGKLSFEKEGKNLSLDVVNAGEEFFIAFADLTSGEETYGAGRFIYTDKPDSNRKVIIDFNKAYNPPCAFTKYATCPLPPKDNYLSIAITAGEKDYGHGN